MVIYRPDGAYVKGSGPIGDLPTIGTPQVRIGVNAPSKAVVRLPASRTPSVTWSNGQTGLIERGMEMTVEYRDAYTKALSMVFRGMIYQVESGETITITAYDRLMDLVQYSDQYQSHTGYDQEAESISRITSGTNYVYRMANTIGSLLTADAVNMLKIDATSQMQSGPVITGPRFIAHPLPDVSGYSPEQGRRITSVKTKVYCIVTGSHTSAIYGTIKLTAQARVILFKKNGGSLNEVASTSFKSWSCSGSTSTAYAPVTASASDEFEWAVDWTINDAPSNYCIGVEITHSVSTSGAPFWTISVQQAYSQYSSTKYTFTGDFYTSGDGISWSSSASGNHPEIGITFEHSGTSVSVNLFSISGNDLTIAQANIPAGPSSTYLSTTDPGIGMIISYFISGATGIKGIVEDLITWAGLVPDVINDDMGQTTYYTSSTYDYMTCLQELLKAGNYGIMASIYEPGKAIVRRRHTISETPVINVTTDPSGTLYEQLVVSHDLTAHWAAEKATQAYIAENATSSGLPIALETDDALMDNSLTEIMQSPMRSVIADNTLGTHDLLANAAGGKMVALHTNIFEGTMTLDGYHVELWDMSSNYCGGYPFMIDVPEYGATGVAVPTEIILGDGVTQVSLNNIRTADRNEVANSMSLSADAISNNATSIPSTVYIFGRYNYSAKLPSANSLTAMVLFNEDSTWTQQIDTTYLKITKDSAGYTHAVGVFPASDYPNGCATTSPINRIFFQIDGSMYAICIDNAKYAYGGQNVHVDIRFESP